MPIPPYIHDFVEEKLDDDFEIFLMKHHNNAENGLCGSYADFINGFTLAMSYFNQDSIPSEDHKWLRIKASMRVGSIFYKLTT